MKTIVLAICFALMGGCVYGQSVCDTLNKAVEDDIKAISSASASGLFNQESELNRRLDMVIYSNLIQSNLLLMQANKCLMPKQPILERAYSDNALKCVLAISKAQRTGDKATPPECEREKWTRSIK